MIKTIALVGILLFSFKYSIASTPDTIHVKVKIAFIDSMDNSTDNINYPGKYLMLGLLQNGKIVECSSKIVFGAYFSVRNEVFIGSIYDVVLERTKVETEEEKSEMEKS